MRRIISSIIIWLLAFNAASAQFTKVELQAAGLTCSMCSKAVDKQLRTLDFVDSVGIDLSHATFMLFFKKDKPIAFDQIKKKVEDAGFSVAKLKATYRFDNFKVESNSSFTYSTSTFYFLNATSTTLNGATTFKIVDKGFVSDKEYQKYAPQIGTKATVGNSLIHTYHVII